MPSRKEDLKRDCTRPKKPRKERIPFHMRRFSMTTTKGNFGTRDEDKEKLGRLARKQLLVIDKMDKKRVDRSFSDHSLMIFPPGMIGVY